MNKRTVYLSVVGFIALGIAACAAFFSVIGLANLFSGNYLEVAVMAGFLEAGKLACASSAYTLRNQVPGWLRSMLVVFVVVMSLVTSLGIFSFLSSSFQEGSNEVQSKQVQVEAFESKIENFEDRAERLEMRVDSQTETVNSVSEKVNERGWKIDAERLEDAESRLEASRAEYSAMRDSVLHYQDRLSRIQTQTSEVETKLGSIEFLVEAAGLDGNKAVLYLILVLIFVFDPMSISMVAAISMASGIEDDLVSKPQTPEPDDTEISKKAEKETPQESKLPDISDVVLQSSRPKKEEDPEFRKWLSSSGMSSL